MTEKPIAIALPTWNPNEPRFVVEKATNYTEDSRVFKTGECVFNQRLGFAYSVDEIVDSLNEINNRNDQLQTHIKELEHRIETLKEVLKSEPFARADGNVTTVQTDKFIRICQENNELKQRIRELEHNV